jgi:hypothetical protein
MSIAEAALYGDLVKYLRDKWAEQAAEFNETPIKEEYAKIDDLIRTWFFTSQDELHGLTPRQVIRNEEQGKPNAIPPDHRHELFDDDCPVCQMTRSDSELGVGGEWHFGLAPDMSLLDEYDPEGYDARWETKAQSFPTDASKRDLPEAREWLIQNPNPQPLAGNRFKDSAAALEFVSRLYAMGAVSVSVDNIYKEVWRIDESGGPYADTLIVALPDDSDARVELRQLFEFELGELQGLDLDQYKGKDELIFWWD